MVGEQGVKGGFAHVAVGVGEQDGNIASEFAEDLAARAAWGSAIFGTNGDGVEFVNTFGDHLENGRSFRTITQSIRRIFDIYACENTAVFRQNRRSHFVLGIGCICLFADGAGGLQ